MELEDLSNDHPVLPPNRIIREESARLEEVLNKTSFWRVMQEKHSWVSPWFVNKRSKLTCVEQVTILLCMVCLDSVVLIMLISL